MLELSLDPRLGRESHRSFRLRTEFAAQEFHRDVPPDATIAGEQDLAHPSFADRVADDVPFVEIGLCGFLHRRAQEKVVAARGLPAADRPLPEGGFWSLALDAAEPPRLA